jgi:hypothetical protein
MYRPARPVEELAIDLLLVSLGEHRYNRSPQEYVYLASIIPPLKQAHYLVNERLRELKEAGIRPYEICYFKPGDLMPHYAPFPTSISIETLRNGLIALGFRIPKRRTSARSTCTA